MKESLSIIKIGGRLIDDPIKLSKCLGIIAEIPGKKILIHGGGKKANDYSKRLGIEPQILDGRRITNAETLELVTMIYAGLINKNIVSQLQSFGCNALGLSGADANSIEAVKRNTIEVDYGYVGDIVYINTEFLFQILELKMTPVICPLTHNKYGQLLNTNADTIASEIGSAFVQKYHITLKYCFEYNGVLKDPSNGQETFPSLNKQTIDSLIERGILKDGILPKLKNALDAKNNRVHRVLICGVENLLSEQNATVIT